MMQMRDLNSGLMFFLCKSIKVKDAFRLNDDISCFGSESERPCNIRSLISYISGENPHRSSLNVGTEKQNPFTQVPIQSY